MGAAIDNDELIRAAYRSLGPEVLQARLAGSVESDRRYLTGIEVALIVGTQIVIQFWIGFANGAKKRLQESGERAGTQAASLLLDRLDEWLSRWRGWPEEELPERAREARHQLDAAVTDVVADLSPADIDSALDATRDEQTLRVTAYLESLSFPPDEAEAHARRVIERLRRKLR
jgi:hypothetical protein